jgi:hypothetical protein
MAEPASVEPPVIQPPVSRRRRGFETLGDMARSLGVVLAVVALVVLITIRTKGQDIRVVDYGSTLAQAKIGAPFVLLAPDGLATQWKPTSVYFDPPARTGVAGVTLWHIGFVTPTGQYAGMEQTNGPPHDAIAAVLDSPAAAGSSSVAGTVWQRWASADGKRRAISHLSGSVAVIVDGTAGWTELEQLAAALRTQN